MRFTQSPSLSRGYNEGNFARRDLDDGDVFDDERGEAEEPAPAARLRWPHPMSSPRDQSARRRPSVVRRMLRTIGRFLFAVLIGVGATLAWQSYGDDARAMLGTWAPSLASLVPFSTAKSASSTASSPSLTQQLQPIALDVAAVRQKVEQLSVDQQQLGANEVQIAESVAKLQALEQDVSQKVASLLEPRTGHARPRSPVQRPLQSSNVR